MQKNNPAKSNTSQNTDTKAAPIYPKLMTAGIEKQMLENAIMLCTMDLVF